jgi:hypothetical protein
MIGMFPNTGGDQAYKSAEFGPELPQALLDNGDLRGGFVTRHFSFGGMGGHQRTMLCASTLVCQLCR